MEKFLPLWLIVMFAVRTNSRRDHRRRRRVCKVRTNCRSGKADDIVLLYVYRIIVLLYYCIIVLLYCFVDDGVVFVKYCSTEQWVKIEIKLNTYLYKYCTRFLLVMDRQIGSRGQQKKKHYLEWKKKWPIFSSDHFFPAVADTTLDSFIHDDACTRTWQRNGLYYRSITYNL